jgi:hypothetical protein
MGTEFGVAGVVIVFDVDEGGFVWHTPVAVILTPRGLFIDTIVFIRLYYKFGLSLFNLLFYYF